MNSLQEVAIWQFRRTTHGSSSLLSPLASYQSLFISLTPPPAPPSPVSLLPSPIPTTPTPHPVHSRGCLPTLSSCPSLPRHVSKLHRGVTAAHEMWDSKRYVLAWCELARRCFLVRRPESHLVWGFKWNAAKTGPKPPLSEKEQLLKAAMQLSVRVMLLINPACFSSSYYHFFRLNNWLLNQ